MNIYIMTQDYYLFTGIDCSLTHQNDYTCFMLDPTDTNITSVVNNCTEQDAFVFIHESSYLNFSLLMKLHYSEAAVVIANNNSQWKVGTIFRFITIPQKFYLSDLLQGIHFRRVSKHPVNFPRFTASEKKVVLLTLEGKTMTGISNRLNIAVKTVYSQQRSAFQKLGIRKSHDMIKLPQDYLHYICGMSELSLV